MKDFSIAEWLTEYVQRVKSIFADRVEFIGIQGSFARGEATENSDIDVVLLLDTFSYDDLKIYKKQLKDIKYREKVCGFVSGIEEIENWNRADLFAFYYDTKPIYGSIEWIGRLIKKADILNSINRDVCDIYHMCIHNGIHEKSVETLEFLFKKAIFVLRAGLFCKTGIYMKSRSDMLNFLNGADKEILMLSMKNIQEIDFDDGTQILMKWADNLIIKGGC